MHCTACLKDQAKAGSNVARELTAHQRKARRPGWLFWTMCGAFVVLCVLLTQMSLDGFPDISGATRFVAFATMLRSGVTMTFTPSRISWLLHLRFQNSDRRPERRPTGIGCGRVATPTRAI